MAANHPPPPNKPHYRTEPLLRWNNPGIGYYGFAPGDRANYWLEHGPRDAAKHYDTEHILEWQVIRSFWHFLDSLTLPNQTQVTQWPSLQGWEVKTLLYRPYNAWAKAADVPPAHPTASAVDRIKHVFGEGNESVLCFLENSLNTLKNNIWNTETSPIADYRWSGNLSFQSYENVDRIENRFCQVASVFAYMTHPTVHPKLVQTINRTRVELRKFDGAYERSEAERNPCNLSSRWMVFIRVHFLTMSSRTENWFNRKFNEFLGYEDAWISQQTADEQTIRARVADLRKTKESAIDVIREAAGIVDR